MPCLVILEMTAKPGTGKVLLEELRTALPETRNKAGCLIVEVTVNQDNPDNVVGVMRWASRQHYETYYAWRVANGDLSRIGEYILGSPSIRFFDLTDV